METDKQLRPSDLVPKKYCEYCYLCAVANVKKKGSKCWWHMPTSMDWPIADNSGMGNASNCRHGPSPSSGMNKNEMPTIPEWATQGKIEEENTENEEGNEQSESGFESAVPQPMQQIETEMEQAKKLLLATFMPLVHNRKLCVQCPHARNGQKTIEISIKNPKEHATIYARLRLPRITVPQAAYKFLEAMDLLIGQLPVEAPANPPAHESPTLLATQMAEGGLSYNFQLSVVWSERQWDLYISSVKTVQAHKEKEMFLPLWTFPWLRQQMAKMLAKLDGNEGIAKMPAIPEWATRALPKIEQQEQQPNEEKKKADDDDDCPCCTKESKCWRHMPKLSGLAKRRPFPHGERLQMTPPPIIMS